MSTKLTPHFTLEELVRTSHEDLQEQNKAQAEDYVDRLYNLCFFILEPLRTYLNKPISVSSGFRGEALNKKVGGVSTSDHSRGMAADIQVDGMSAKELMDFIVVNKGIFTDKLHKAILEQVKGREWVHISFRDEDALGQFLCTTNGRDYEVYA